MKKIRVPAEEAHDLGESVEVSYLGMGSSGRTWYGTPDARLKGCVPDAEWMMGGGRRRE